jgi:hypothetical protein
MVTKLAFALAVLAALVVVPAAAGDGPAFVTTGGAGVVGGTTRYIPSDDGQGDNTQLLAVSTKDGTLLDTLTILGQWGLPSTPAGAEGLSHDGHTLVLGDVQAGTTSPSKFMVLRPKGLRIVDTISLKGYFSYDAMSPDGKTLYLIQYLQGDGTVNLSQYIVRGYDVATNRLLPGRIADRTQKSWVMQGYPMTRTTSPDGRWVYTLYQNPGGFPFIHALDTVRGVAHCIGIPLQNQSGISNLRLSLRGKTLSVGWRSGRPFVDVDTSTWRVTPVHRGGFPWWTLSFAALGLLVLLGRVLRRTRLVPDASPVRGA